MTVVGGNERVSSLVIVVGEIREILLIVVGENEKDASLMIVVRRNETHS